MKPESVRRYLMVSLEFGAYCVMMTLLSYLMVLLVLRAPQPNSWIYITVALVAALLTGIHAGRMFRMYRVALERLRARAKKKERPRHWSDRIAAAEAVRRQDSLRERLARDEASPALQAIRLRIAERMAREDREREEMERAERDRSERDRLDRMERARTARIRAEVGRKMSSDNR
ncbi:hypothetical protein [Sphingomonas sp. R1]|uniref:hypothetical protein n=1 Tax=Sphingomonas sp. R1 TaxID=399176 RepID=UPI0022240203|nr:hypothetical protein [Sphingomonas sp. R1]UYY78729.1 hypothetical protein OIM94_07035 [Sphingomonas sp. R1]